MVYGLGCREQGVGSFGLRVPGSGFGFWISGVGLRAEVILVRKLLDVRVIHIFHEITANGAH